MQVSYDSVPLHDASGPVGFTAYANTGYPTPYNVNDIVIFDEVLSNFGGHYNPVTSSFICPWHGVYLMNAHVLGGLSDFMLLNLMRNSELLAEINMDELTGVHNQGGMTIMTECDRGDILWIRAGYTGTIAAYPGQRYTSFTAYMLHRF